MQASFHIGIGGDNGTGRGNRHNSARRNARSSEALRRSNRLRTRTAKTAAQRGGTSRTLCDNSQHRNSSVCTGNGIVGPNFGKRQHDSTANDNGNTNRKKRRKIAPSLFDRIEPVFAMMPAGFQPGNVLDTGYGGIQWSFNLERYLSQIHNQYPVHDLYVVGYRVEERPGIASEGFRDAFPNEEEGKRIPVPFFAVHAIPQRFRDKLREQGKSGDPETIVLKNDNEQEFKNLRDLSLKWSNVATLENGAVVKLLESNIRHTCTARRTSYLPPAHVGGYLFFQQPPVWTRNHGEDFEFEVGGEKFPFFDDIWQLTKAAAKKSVTANFENIEAKKEEWAAFMKTENTTQWMDLFLPLAVDQYFEYYEDLSREQFEEDVRQNLKSSFESVREQLVSENFRYQQFAEELNQSKNFKIYPENSFLKKYLTKGRLNKISQWIPGNEEIHVYPTVESTKEVVPRTIWG